MKIGKEKQQHKGIQYIQEVQFYNLSSKIRTNLLVLMCCNIGFIHRIFIANRKTNKCNVFVKGHMKEKKGRDVNLIESPFEHFVKSFKSSLLSLLYEKQMSILNFTTTFYDICEVYSQHMKSKHIRQQHEMSKNV